jgi:group I intron endonuclease
MIVYSAEMVEPKKAIYIGCTTRSLCSRKIEHRHVFKKNVENNLFYNFIRKYGWDNFDWKIIGISLSDDFSLEKFFIKYYKGNYDGKILNCTDGGDGVINPSEETRKKRSEFMIGRFSGEKNPMYGRTGERSPMYGRRGELSPTFGIHRYGEESPMYGKHHTDETKLKIRNAMSGKNHPNWGKHHSDETKLKQSLAKIGLTPSVETRLKMSLSQRGRKHSEETKMKISIANKGKKQTRGHRENLSKARIEMFRLRREA